jgi:quinol monooxygenase YgiN
MIGDTAMVSDPALLLVAEMHGLVGRAAELERLLTDLAVATRADPACLAYHVASLPEPGEYLVLASWRDERSFRAHYVTDAYARYRGEVGPLLARPSDAVLHRVSSTVRARDPDPPEPGMLG